MSIRASIIVERLRGSLAHSSSVGRGLIGAALIPIAYNAFGCADGYRSAPHADITVVEPVQSAPPPVITNKCEPIGGELLCICPNGTETGTRTCMPALADPEQGTLSACLPCDGRSIHAGTGAAGSSGRRGLTTAAGSVSEPARSESGDVELASAGSAAGSGSGGTGGTGGGDDAADAASSTAGSAGAANRSPLGTPLNRFANPLAPAPGLGCECDQPCFPFGIIACCRMDGSCGCSWAPGAYCL